MLKLDSKVIPFILNMTTIQFVSIAFMNGFPNVKNGSNE